MIRTNLCQNLVVFFCSGFQSQGTDGRWQPGSHRHGWPVAVVLLPRMSTTPDEVGSTGGAGGAESAPPPALTSDPPELEGQSDGAGGGGGLSQRRPRTNDTSRSGEAAGMSLSPTDGSGDAFSPDTVKQMVQHLSPRSRDDDGERCANPPRRLLAPLHAPTAPRGLKLAPRPASAASEIRVGEEFQAVVPPISAMERAPGAAAAVDARVGQPVWNPSAMPEPDGEPTLPPAARPAARRARPVC